MSARLSAVVVYWLAVSGFYGASYYRVVCVSVPKLLQSLPDGLGVGRGTTPIASSFKEVTFGETTFGLN